MNTINPVRVRTASAGDAAVGGLLHGLAAGLAMAALLVLAGLAQGQSPAGVLGVFAISGEPNVLAGLLGHLAVAGVYGLVWGVVWRALGPRLRVPAILAGLIYGLLLWGVSQVLVRSIGAQLALLAPWALLGGHLVYGLVVGFLSRKV
jgi:hypothetical protein